MFRKDQEAFTINHGEYLGFENEEIARMTSTISDRQVELNEAKLLEKTLKKWINDQARLFKVDSEVKQDG